jgi:hypothetical protein
MRSLFRESVLVGFGLAVGVSLYLATLRVVGWLLG